MPFFLVRLYDYLLSVFLSGASTVPPMYGCLEIITPEVASTPYLTAFTFSQVFFSSCIFPINKELVCIRIVAHLLYLSCSVVGFVTPF